MNRFKTQSRAKPLNMVKVWEVFIKHCHTYIQDHSSLTALNKITSCSALLSNFVALYKREIMQIEIDCGIQFIGETQKITLRLLLSKAIHRGCLLCRSTLPSAWEWHLGFQILRKALHFLSESTEIQYSRSSSKLLYHCLVRSNKTPLNNFSFSP